MLSNLFGGPHFSGSYFDEIPVEHIGWVLLLGFGPGAAAAIFGGAPWVLAVCVLGLVIGSSLVTAAHTFRYGFTRGRVYQPPPLGSMPSIGPPM